MIPNKNGNVYYIDKEYEPDKSIDQEIESEENVELFTGELDVEHKSAESAIMYLQELLLNPQRYDSLNKNPSEAYQPLKEGSDSIMVDKRIDKLEHEIEKHKEITELKLQGIEERLESKIDSSMNQMLGAIKDMESRLNVKLTESQTSTMNRLNEIKDNSLSENDVKVVIASELRNASGLKHTQWGVYIAIVVPILILIAELLIK
ncbi:hypothetical protein [Exiguobacterium sp. s191]|uniref:hypothetical protein n=1 Tax=Exiguobacterium sp. s191 TaxID=2751196 RepID=UPI001BE5C36C|nr:hypothetical protein [Exiguobacterium sp. s191]